MRAVKLNCCWGNVMYLPDNSKAAEYDHYHSGNVSFRGSI